MTVPLAQLYSRLSLSPQSQFMTLPIASIAGANLRSIDLLSNLLAREKALNSPRVCISLSSQLIKFYLYVKSEFTLSLSDIVY